MSSDLFEKETGKAPGEIQAATDRIADQIRRILTRETTFAEVYELIRKELTDAYETGQQESSS